MNKIASLTIGIALAATVWFPRAKAEFIVNIDQVGSNVVETGSGSLSLNGAVLFDSGAGAAPSTHPSSAPSILLGLAPLGSVDAYIGAITGPGNFGTGGQTFADIGTGDSVGIAPGGRSFILVPAGYVSGRPLTDSDTYNSQTFASMGLAIGTYTYTLPADTFVINVNAPAAVPEPSSVSALAPALGLAMLFASRRRREDSC